MPPTKVMIADIHPKLENWRARLTLSKVFPPIKDAWVLQKFIFTDSNNDEIEVIVWGEHNLNKISPRFELYSAYDIGVRRIDEVKSTFKLVGCEYQLVLTPNDYLNKIENEAPSVPCLGRAITSFDVLIPLMDTFIPINVLAVVVDCGVTKDTATGKGRWLKVITRERKLMLLTLWNEHAIYYGPILDRHSQEFPVISVRRAIVRSFHTISISTVLRKTSVGINPPLEEAYTLKSWFMSIKDSLSSELLATTEKQFTMELIARGSKKFYSVAHIENEKLAGHYLTQATIQCVQKKKMYFAACKLCNSSTNYADIGEEIKCLTCSKRTTLVPRAILNLDIEDMTTKMTLPALGETAENILNVKATDLFELYGKGTPFDVTDVNEKLKSKLHNIKIVKSIRESTSSNSSSNSQQQRTTVAAVFPVDDPVKTTEEAPETNAPPAIEVQPSPSETPRRLSQEDDPTTPKELIIDPHVSNPEHQKKDDTEQGISTGSTKKTTRKSLEADLAKEEKEFQKKMKAAMPETAHI